MSDKLKSCRLLYASVGRQCIIYVYDIKLNIYARSGVWMSGFVAHETYDRLLEATIGQDRMNLLLFLWWCVYGMCTGKNTNILARLLFLSGAANWNQLMVSKLKQTEFISCARTMKRKTKNGSNTHFIIYTYPIFQRIESWQFDAYTSSFIENHVKSITNKQRLEVRQHSQWVQLFSSGFSHQKKSTHKIQYDALTQQKR